MIKLLDFLQFDEIEADSCSLKKIGFKIFSSIQLNSKVFELVNLTKFKCPIVIQLIVFLFSC